MIQLDRLNIILDLDNTLINALEEPEREKIPLSFQEKFEYAAKECWKEYERKSLSNLEKQQIAYMCEGMDKRAAEAR